MSPGPLFFCRKLSLPYLRNFIFAAVIEIVVPVRPAQGEGEGASDALGADQVDVFPVSPDDFADNRQAEPCPFFILAAGKVGFVKAVPDELLVIFWDSNTIVADADKDGLALFCGLNGDLGIFPAEFYSVVDEVVEYLLDLFQVRIDIEEFSHEKESDLQVSGPAGLFKRSRDRPDHGIDVKIRALQKDTAAIEIIEGQQALGQLGEAFRLPQDYPQIMVVPFGRDRAVQHGFQKPPHGSERGAEIMGDISNEFFLIILRAGDRIRHISKGGGKISQFVLSFDRSGKIHVSEGILFCCCDDTAQGTVDIFCKDQEDDQGQDDEDHQLDVGNVEHAVRLSLDHVRGQVDDHIAPDLEITGDRGYDA